MVRSAQNRIPRNDWDRAPWNRWSFQHVRELLPTVEVWRGHGPVWSLPTTKKDLGHIVFLNSHNATTTVQDWLDSSFTDGFAVIHKGTLVYEQYYNGMTARTPHLSQSVAKSVTSAVAGVLVGRGLLDPEQLIVNYLPELAQTGWHDATLRQCLDMMSGVKYIEDYDSLHSDIALTDIASGWKLPEPGTVAPACIWDQILTLNEQTREHGILFEYRSIETDVLAHCMERVTGTPLADLLSRELWQPLGAEENAYFTVDSVGYALADGGFNACLRDFGRFGLMLANGGAANDKQVLPIEWINDTFNCNPGLFHEPYTHILPDGAYRNQFWIRDFNRRVLMARGVFGQLIYVDLDNHLVVVKLSSWPEFLSVELRVDELNAIDAIHAHLNDTANR